MTNENGTGFLSGVCSCNSLKFIDFLLILGGVPVFNLPIENFNDSILFARFIEGLSPALPAGYDSFPILIKPLKKVPVVNTTALAFNFIPPSKITPLIFSLYILKSSTEFSNIVRFFYYSWRRSRF